MRILLPLGVSNIAACPAHRYMHTAGSAIAKTLAKCAVPPSMVRSA